MTSLFLILAILGLAFTANAWRPTRRLWASVFVFFAGWLTAELAPLLLLTHIGVVTWFIAAGAVEGWQGWLALGLSAVVAGNLVAIMAEAIRGRAVVEASLVDGLGADYRDAIGESGSERIPWRTIFMPFLLWGGTKVKRHRSIPYGPVRRRNLLDVYTARASNVAEGRAPVLLYVHGGAWINVSNKNHQGKPLMHHMAERGWVCVAANYRLSPRATFPDHLIDVKRAIRWIRENIETYGGDASTLVITGGSAGAHLSALAALTQNDPEYQPEFEDADTSISACIPSYGIYDFTPDSGGKMAVKRMAFLERMIMKAKHDDDPEPFRKASPHHRVGEGVPPFMVIHGGNDTLAPPDEARAFVARLKEQSTEPVVFTWLDRAQHAFDVFHSIRSAHVVRGIARFCEWVYQRDHAEKQRVDG